MSDQQVVAEDKKDEKEFPPLPKGDTKFTEMVTLKYWNPDKKIFNATKDNLGALRFHNKVQKCFVLDGKDSLIKPVAGSEIADADGFTYIVESAVNSAPNIIVRVKNKP